MKPLTLLASLALLLSAPAAAQTVDTAGVGRVLAAGAAGSELMANLRHLSDSIGPRLSGSAAMQRANDWAAARFAGYGLTVAQEAYPFGVTWERGPVVARLVAPFTRPVVAWSWAWTAGTGGRPLAGPIVRADVSTPESLAVYRDRMKGAWVMLAEPAWVWNPDGPAMTAADSADRDSAMEARRRAFRQADTAAAAVAARRQFMVDRPYLMKQAGALGTLTDGAKEHALVTMSGSPNRISPLPNLVVSHEDYLMFDRQLDAGLAPRFEAAVSNTLGERPVEQRNVVAEIRGSERPGQVVILGAHFDSWDLAQGVTDNGASSIAVMEAARILRASGVRPKRTIRFILFSGEEQGLLGSRAYAAAHAAEADSIQAVMVLDNGTGRILGQALQGRDQLADLWRALLAPVAHLDADSVRAANKGGTDHLAFLPYGVPGFNFDQEPRGYFHTHHSQSDTYDKAVADDLQQAATVMAVTALELANLPELLPRGERSEVTPPAPARPSPGLEKVAAGD